MPWNWRRATRIKELCSNVYARCALCPAQVCIRAKETKPHLGAKEINLCAKNAIRPASLASSSLSSSWEMSAHTLIWIENFRLLFSVALNVFSVFVSLKAGFVFRFTNRQTDPSTRCRGKKREPLPSIVVCISCKNSIWFNYSEPSYEIPPFQCSKASNGSMETTTDRKIGLNRIQCVFVWHCEQQKCRILKFESHKRDSYILHPQGTFHISFRLYSVLFEWQPQQTHTARRKKSSIQMTFNANIFDGRVLVS